MRCQMDRYTLSMRMSRCVRLASNASEQERPSRDFARLAAKRAYTYATDGGTSL